MHYAKKLVMHTTGICSKSVVNKRSLIRIVQPRLLVDVMCRKVLLLDLSVVSFEREPPIMASKVVSWPIVISCCLAMGFASSL